MEDVFAYGQHRFLVGYYTRKSRRSGHPVNEVFISDIKYLNPEEVVPLDSPLGFKIQRFVTNAVQLRQTEEAALANGTARKNGKDERRKRKRE